MIKKKKRLLKEKDKVPFSSRGSGASPQGFNISEDTSESKVKEKQSEVVTPEDVFKGIAVPREENSEEVVRIWSEVKAASEKEKEIVMKAVK